MCTEAIKNEQQLWLELTSNPKGDYIKNISDFESYMVKKRNSLTRLSKEDLQKFKSDLTFTDLIINEQVSSLSYRIQKVSAINWKIPVAKYDFTVKEMEEVASEFGISAIHLWTTYNRYPLAWPNPPGSCGVLINWSCFY
jgi:hypothetical protein